jgi:DNA-binding response OmpR family regulator
MSGQTSMKMLSIDDRTMTTELDRAGYRKMGVYVRPAASYDEATKILASEEIDIIVVNMDYKPVDSTQVTKHLKTMEKYKAIPIVLTSVQTSARIRNSAIDAGADLFVEQPLPRQYFIEKIKQLLDQKTRTTERVDIHGHAVFTLNGKQLSCPIGDLSNSGILLTTNEEYESGVSITLEFDIPGQKKTIKVDGEIVRQIKLSNKHPDRQTGIGIKFVKFHGDSEKRLEKYIATSAPDSKMQYYL